MMGGHGHDHRVFEPGPFSRLNGLIVVGGGVGAGIGLIVASWQFQQRKQVRLGLVVVVVVVGGGGVVVIVVAVVFLVGCCRTRSSGGCCGGGGHVHCFRLLVVDDWILRNG